VHERQRAGVALVLEVREEVADLVVVVEVAEAEEQAVVAEEEDKL